MMSSPSKREYLIEVRRAYRTATKIRKSQLLDDFCAFCGYHRKYALSLMSKPLPSKWKRKKVRVRSRIFTQDSLDAVITLWRAAGEICAERLHPFIPELLECLKRCGEMRLDEETERLVLRMSLATVKRTIRSSKRCSLIRIGGTTKPGTLLKHQIQITNHAWSEDRPGFCELDTVAHCGESLSGTFAYTLDLVDLATHWSEQEAFLGKGEIATQEGLASMRSRLPFPLLGIDSDNGSEFINWTLYYYCQKEGITLTRCRPYHKNEQAHIEEKNYTAVRQLLGYGRIESADIVALMNDLYRQEWHLFLNYFQPTLKLEKKEKNLSTGKVKKTYEKAKTPYRRVMEHPDIPEETKAMLRLTYEHLNPITLQRVIREKLKPLRRT